MTNTTVAFNSFATSHHGSGFRVTGGTATLRNTLVPGNGGARQALEPGGSILPFSSRNVIRMGATPAPTSRASATARQCWQEHFTLVVFP